MLFCIYATDKPDALETRLATRQAHLDYINEHYADKMVCAGPRLSDDGEAMIGSSVIIDLADKAAVDDYCKNDPYSIAGIFEKVEITRFKLVFPQP